MRGGAYSERPRADVGVEFYLGVASPSFFGRFSPRIHVRRTPSAPGACLRYSCPKCCRIARPALSWSARTSRNSRFVLLPTAHLYKFSLATVCLDAGPDAVRSHDRRPCTPRQFNCMGWDLELAWASPSHVLNNESLALPGK